MEAELAQRTAEVDRLDRRLSEVIGELEERISCYLVVRMIELIHFGRHQLSPNKGKRRTLSSSRCQHS